MYWSIERDTTRAQWDGSQPDGRFVIHHHRDALGPHLDLRLEQDGYLMGWRIDACTLDDRAWATEKAPHPTHWLTQDGEAIREDEGVYRRRIEGDTDCLLLHGSRGLVALRVRREPGIAASQARAICAFLHERGIHAAASVGLMKDGVLARHRAVERLCGLARELDGAAFNEEFWRKTLDGLCLDDIHAQLRAYEIRFDAKYPPAPVSRPESLPDETGATRKAEALAIARG